MPSDEVSFRRLVDAAVAVPLRGWDFSFLEGRTVAEPLPWDYVALAREATARATCVLDVDTGGGEVFSAVAPPAGSIGVEPYPPNVAVATAALALHHVEVRQRHGARLPVADGEVDLVLNRHGRFDPTEAARVLRPGGLLLSQQVGRDNDLEINEVFGVPPADTGGLGSVEEAVAALVDAGLQVVRCEEAWPRTAYLDVGALVLQLRAVSWQVPWFDVGRDLEKLRRVHQVIRHRGSFSVTSHRLLVLGRRPRRT